MGCPGSPDVCFFLNPWSTGIWAHDHWVKWENVLLIFLFLIGISVVIGLSAVSILWTFLDSCTYTLAVNCIDNPKVFYRYLVLIFCRYFFIKCWLSSRISVWFAIDDLPAFASLSVFSAHILSLFSKYAISISPAHLIGFWACIGDRQLCITVPPEMVLWYRGSRNIPTPNSFQEIQAPFMTHAAWMSTIHWATGLKVVSEDSQPVISGWFSVVWDADFKLVADWR